MSDRAPSLYKLRQMDMERRWQALRPGIEREAKQFGIPFSDHTSTYRLATMVNRHRVVQERPELEARARALGVRTRWGWGAFGFDRDSVSVSLACHCAEERQRLMGEMRWTDY